ncbi:MAG TPA: hypothetical protein VNJ02_10570 [Vicinamibacterales bacterium]|nr:hypothetical protein [Vicinamibacterales bacterium]
MPEPIEFRAVQNLQAALAGISTGGGYHYTVQASAVKLDPNHKVEDLVAPNGPRPFVLVDLGDEKWEYAPGKQIRRLTLPVTVWWVSDTTPTDDNSLLQTYFRGCADIEQAIAQDISRGGLCTDTRIVKRGLNRIGEGSQVWAGVELELWFHRPYGQPN